MVFDRGFLGRLRGHGCGYSWVEIRFDGGLVNVVGDGDTELADRVLEQNPTIKVRGRRK
jgi:hypothetical protein